MFNQTNRINIGYRTTQALLILSSLLLLFIGTNITFAPHSFYEGYGISLDSTFMLSELRAPAGMLITVGLFSLAGAFSHTHKQTALFVSAGLYLSYAVARLFGFAVDGGVSEDIVIVAGLELALGVLFMGALAIYKYSGGSEQSQSSVNVKL